MRVLKINDLPEKPMDTATPIAGWSGGPVSRPRPAEVRVIDPWGNNVDLSSRGFLGREEIKLPGVRLLAVQVPNPDEACEFYKGQFELEVVGRDSDGTIRLSDGTVTLLLTKSQVRPKNGVQYFGIQVDDIKSVKRRLQNSGVELSEKANGQIQLNDPEGNQVIVSENGWMN